MPRRSKPVFNSTLVTVGVSVVSAFCGGLINAYTLASNVATKPYVDSRAAVTLKDAQAYSDLKAQGLMIKLTEQGSDVRAVSVKTDMILTLLNNDKNKGE